MRHFAAGEAGNWGSLNRIIVAVFEPVQRLVFCLYFLSLEIIQPQLPEVSEAR